MGCNCSKTPLPNGRPVPAGQGGSADQNGNGGLSGQTQSFRLSTKPGMTFGSLLEARAELVRQGGGTISPA